MKAGVTAGVMRRWGALAFEIKIAIGYTVAASILLGSLLVFGVRQARGQDRAADDYTSRAVAAAIDERSRNFSSWVKGYALWDDMHAHMVLRTDAGWADSHVGSGVWQTFSTPMSGVYVIDRNDRQVYAYWAKGSTPPIATFEADLPRLRRAADASQEPIVTRIVQGSKPYFLGIGRIRAMDAAQERQPASPRYLVLLQPVEPVLVDVARSMLIQGLHWQPYDEDGRHASLDIFPSMRMQGIIVWTAREPGTAMLRSAITPTLILILVTCLVGVAQFSMARRLARMLEEKRREADAEARNSLAASKLALAAENEARTLTARLREQEVAVDRLSAEREAEGERRKDLARAQSLATLSRFEHDFDTVLEPISEIAGILSVQSGELQREAVAGRSAAATVLEAARGSMRAIDTVVEGNRELDVATKGLDSEINRAVRSTRQVERTVDDLIDRLSELSASGTAVEGIVSTVAALARRINMLAMNARIEAAHAGPAGRGFAVVADEVKQLASMTRDATASIVEVMRTMDANTETAISGIEEIRPVIAEIVELTSLSRTALDRQTDIAERIIDAVGRARASVSDTDCAMRNLDQVIGSSERLGRDLSDAADELGSRSAQLQKSAGQFADGLRKAGGSGAA